MDPTEQLVALLNYVRADGRICPQPMCWNDLWELLPDRKRTDMDWGWDPPLPLILAGWWASSDLQKSARLKEHIEYAASHGVLDSVEVYLRGLLESDWHRVRVEPISGPH